MWKKWNCVCRIGRLGGDAVGVASVDSKSASYGGAIDAHTIPASTCVVSRHGCGG